MRTITKEQSDKWYEKDVDFSTLTTEEKIEWCIANTPQTRDVWSLVYDMVVLAEIDRETYLDILSTVDYDTWRNS